MFPRLRRHLTANLDLLVELSTLGEYGLAEDGTLLRLDPVRDAPRPAPRVRDECQAQARPPAPLHAARI